MTKLEFVWPGEDYNPVKHVTAGELRELPVGLLIPNNIPDCAWVPRSAIRSGDGASSVGEDGVTLNLSMMFGFTEPFRWQRQFAEIDASPDEIKRSIKDFNDRESKK